MQGRTRCLTGDLVRNQGNSEYAQVRCDCGLWVGLVGVVSDRDGVYRARVLATPCLFVGAPVCIYGGNICYACAYLSLPDLENVS